MSIGNYAMLPAQPAHSIDRNKAMALHKLFVSAQVNNLGVGSVQFGPMNSLGDQQAVHAHVDGAGYVGMDGVADGEDAIDGERFPPSLFEEANRHAIDRLVGFSRLFDFAAQLLVTFGQRAGAIDQLIAAIDDQIGIGANHRQIFRAAGDQNGLIIGWRFFRVVNQPGADRESGLRKRDRRDIMRGQGAGRRENRPVAVRSDVEWPSRGALCDRLGANVAGCGDGVIAIGAYPQPSQLFGDLALGTGSVGDERHRFAAPPQFAQGFDGGRKVALAVVEHAPDVAQECVIMILRLGESCQDDSVRRRAGHGNIGHVAALTAHWNEVKPELGMHLPSSLCSEPRPPRRLLSRLVGVVAPAYDSAALRNQIMKQAKTAASLVKARLPRGLADRGADEIAAVDAMLAAIRCNYELYGFEAIETPAIEYTDALGKFLPDQDRPNDGVFSFQDDDEQWLSLRYDLTAPLARHFAENFESLPKPYRTLRYGFVFRNEKPGPGRFRQFLQFDADTIGSASPAADAELCMMAADTLEKLGIARGDYCIKVNNRKILDGVMEALGLGAPEDASRRLVVLRAIDKLDRLGPQGVRLLLGAGRKDESGDFTKGAGLDSESIEKVIAFTAARRSTNLQTLEALEAIVSASARGMEGVEELRAIDDLVRAGGYNENRISLDPSVVRGLEYYTGPVFEADLSITATDEKGQPVRFGSVGGGGRYDGLIARFRGEDAPATGFSIGVSRLYAALKAIQSPIVARAPHNGPVIVLVMDRDRVANYQSLVSRLRDSGVRAELYLGAAGMKAQMKYADRRKSPCVVIQGSDERARGEVQIKDLIEGARAADAIASNEEWKAARPAQIAVSEDGMVAAVQEIFERHGL